VNVGDNDIPQDGGEPQDGEDLGMIESRAEEQRKAEWRREHGSCPKCHAEPPPGQSYVINHAACGHGAVVAGAILDDVRAWLGRYICTLEDTDLDILTLWAAHTWLCNETYISPRLLIDSPMEGSGKTTTLEHLERLCRSPLQMASVSSAALLTRTLATGIRTLLIDEVDKTLASGKEYISDVIAILNTGYKRGASRPVLVHMDGNWVPVEMPTFAPCAMAGTQPDLPNDTLSRCIRVLLLPADEVCEIDDSDWEWIGEAATKLGTRLMTWADEVRGEVQRTRTDLPKGIRGRDRERWAPLKRVAVAYGGRWPELVDKLALVDVTRVAAEREQGIVRDRPAVLALRHILEVWPANCDFLPSEGLIALLIHHHPEVWGKDSTYGRDLTPQRLGRMLAKAYDIHTGRLNPPNGPRGYYRTYFDRALRRLKLLPELPK
jgi:hypothetical protein